MDAIIRQCNKCKKRFVLEKGFHKKGKGYYHHTCKSCRNKINVQREKDKKGSYNNHLYEAEINNISVCKRCGLKRKAQAGRYMGEWIFMYMVHGKWQKERPKCIKQKKSD